MQKTKEKVQLLVDVTIEYNSKAARAEALALARDIGCDSAGAGAGGMSYSAKSGRVRVARPSTVKAPRRDPAVPLALGDPTAADYACVLGLPRLVMLRVPARYRHADLLKGLTAMARHYGARRKDIAGPSFISSGLDWVTRPDKGASDSQRAENALMRPKLDAAYQDESRGFLAFDLWLFDGHAISLVRERVQATA